MSRGILNFFEKKLNFFFLTKKGMLYMPRFVINNEFVPVSVYFIENFLKEANGAFVKVYLFGLHLAVMNTEIDTASIAKDLHIYEGTPAREFMENRVITGYGSITASKIFNSLYLLIIKFLFVKVFLQTNGPHYHPFVCDLLIH